MWRSKHVRLEKYSAGLAAFVALAAVARLHAQSPNTRSSEARPAMAASTPQTPDSVAAANRARRADAEALYARATAQLARQTADDVFTAIDGYRAATVRDSSFAPAYAGLSQAYTAVLERGWLESQQMSVDAVTRGLAAADRALRLDPRQEDAWVARGTLLEYRSPRSLDGVFRSYQRALILDPHDAEALRLYARATAYTGDFRSAEERYRRALAAGTQRANALCDLADLAYIEGKVDKAKRLLDSASSVDPSVGDGHLLRVRMLLRKRDFRDAWVDAEMAARLGYPIPGAASSILVWARMPDSAATSARADSLARAARRSRTVLPVIDARYVALTFVAIGKPVAALEALERAYPRGASLWLAMQDPGLGPLASEPRFKRLTQESRSTVR